MAAEQHTELPWKVSCVDLISILDQQGHVIAVASAYENDRPGEVIANAEYIVRAANCHEDLGEALRKLTDALASDRGSWCREDSRCVPIHTAFDIACDALAKARGEAS